MGFLKRHARRLKRCERGTTLLEFSFLAPFFLAVVFSVYEVSMYFYTVTALQESVDNAGRTLRTGEDFYATGDPCGSERNCFFEAVCRTVNITGNCTSNLAVEVTSFADLVALDSDTSTAVCPSDTGYTMGSTAFQTGVPGGIIRVRACYELHMLNPALGLKLGKTADGDSQIIVSTILRNEPGGAGT